MIRLDKRVYQDKVRAAWLGKTIGGTLGAPYEGGMEQLSLDFYNPIPAQAAPNDDLDLQLVWLDALTQLGPSLTSADLGRAWLDHITYPYDEYAFAKANLRRGILPPLSGSFNNPFRECMGAPIRSEIWALVCPGVPWLAATYAYKDAVVDHSGDGVWGEMFFAALESAAFVLSDPKMLIDVGRNMIPADCRTSQVVQAVLNAREEGLSWQQARERVIAGFGGPNFTYAPPNIGFTLIGWLWNPQDFGAALCCAVNCGYDTDCTGATLGAILGIVGGTESLPERWLRPIGTDVVAGWGIQGVDLPKTIDDLTGRTVSAGERCLSENAVAVTLVETSGTAESEGEVTVPAAGATPSDAAVATESQMRSLGPSEMFIVLSDNARARALWSRSASLMEVKDGALGVVGAFEKLPAAVGGETTPVVATLHNVGSEGMSGVPRWTAPSGWELATRQMPISLAPDEATNLAAVLKPPKGARFAPSALVELSFAEKRVAFHLAPAMRWGAVGPFPNIEAGGFNSYYPPEDNADPKHHFLLRSDIVETYEIRTFRECVMDIDRHFRNAAGTVYLRTWVLSPSRRSGRLAVFSNDGARVWVHRQPALHFHYHEPFVPRAEPPFIAEVSLNAGENELLIKFIRCATSVDALVYITDMDGHQMTDLQFVFGD